MMILSCGMAMGSLGATVSSAMTVCLM